MKGQHTGYTSRVPPGGRSSIVFGDSESVADQRFSKPTNHVQVQERFQTNASNDPASRTLKSTPPSSSMDLYGREKVPEQIPSKRQILVPSSNLFKEQDDAVGTAPGNKESQKKHQGQSLSGIFGGDVSHDPVVEQRRMSKANNPQHSSTIFGFSSNDYREPTNYQTSSFMPNHQHHQDLPRDNQFAKSRTKTQSLADHMSKQHQVQAADGQSPSTSRRHGAPSGTSLDGIMGQQSYPVMAERTGRKKSNAGQSSLVFG